MALTAAFFAGLGSLAFHVASLTSGYSIYRELGWRVSMLITTSLGLFLLLMSPVGYLIFLRDDFRPGREILSYEQFAAIWSLASIGPYLLSALGAGLVIGSLTMIKGRVLFWKWLRSKSGMLYPIYSYDHIWDVFLHSLKREGRVDILRKTEHESADRPAGEWIHGRLLHFSERNETREILIERPVSGNWRDTERVLIPGDEVLCIKAPARAFSRDHQLIATYSRAFYYLLAGFGAALVAASIHLTQGWIVRNRRNQELDLLEIYPCIELLLEAAAVFLIILSLLSLCRRYAHYVGKWAGLHPVFVSVAVMLLLLVGSMIPDVRAPEQLGAVRLLYVEYAGVFDVARGIFAVAIVGLLLLAPCCNWLPRVSRAGRRLASMSDEMDRELGTTAFDRCLDIIYLNYDWNSDDEWYRDAFTRQVRRILENEGGDHREEVAHTANRFVEIANQISLDGDEINLVYWVRNFRLRKRRKNMRRKRPGEPAYPEFLLVWAETRGG